MTKFVGNVAISLIFDGFVACLAAPLVLWGPEGLAAYAALCRPVAACAAGWDAPIEEFARRHRGLEAGGFDGRLARLAG